MGGLIGCLDLATGQSRTLVELPGRPVVWQLVLSRDGSALACVTRPQFFGNDSAQAAGRADGVELSCVARGPGGAAGLKGDHPTA